MFNQVNPLQYSQPIEIATVWTDLDKFYSAVEKKFLNPLGYIPIVGTLTGMGRISYGAVQGSIATIGMAVEPIFGALTSRTHSVRHYDAMGTCVEHAIHSSLNVIRGTVELIPFLPWLVCAPLDLTGGVYSYRTDLPDCYVVTKQTQSDFRK